MRTSSLLRSSFVNIKKRVRVSQYPVTCYDNSDSSLPFSTCGCSLPHSSKSFQKISTTSNPRNSSKIRAKLKSCTRHHPNVTTDLVFLKQTTSFLSLRRGRSVRLSFSLPAVAYSRIFRPITVIIYSIDLEQARCGLHNLKTHDSHSSRLSTTVAPHPLIKDNQHESHNPQNDKRRAPKS